MGRHSESGWPVFSCAVPNWFNSSTLKVGWFDVVIDQHNRWAAGLLIGVTRRFGRFF